MRKLALFAILPNEQLTVTIVGMMEKGLREIKKEATAEALAQAAYDLAMEHGVDGFVIDDVVQRAGYSRRTFANYFSCKEEAIASVLRGDPDDFEELVRGLPEDTPLVDVLHAAIRRQLNSERVEQTRNVILLCEAHPALQPYLLEVVSRLRLQGIAVFQELGEDHYSEQYVNLLFGMAFGVLALLFDGSVDVSLPRGSDTPVGPTPLEGFVDTAFTYLRMGFEPKPI